ncbi:MAG: asparagine synthase (glutamine-hydrolyzing) [Pseudomonadota bacterium]
MCGIVGIWRLKGASGDSDVGAIARKMGHAIRRRGPDGEDVWADAEAGIGLAHQRLSIIDLSDAGRQPMASSCGRFVIAYNGELYNTQEIRTQLESRGRNFRGHSDTEAIVEACAEFGVEDAVARMRGMFAFALWDKRRRQLTLCRDRLGIKPLYWTMAGDQLIFGSELKALLASGQIDPDVNRKSLTTYLRYGYVPGEESIWRDIKKLRPGSFLTFGADGASRETVYWSAKTVALNGISQRGADGRSDAEQLDTLEALLSDTVSRHMISDVSIGAFLSGGVDSSLVAALMQKNSDRAIKTFTIAFNENAFNEAEHARAVADHIGSDHTEMAVTEKDARDIVPSLPDIFDEPLGDPSQIPTYLLSKLTRQHVTVALSGDGGDEFFAGYERYARAQSLAQLTRGARAPLARLAASGVRLLPVKSWDKVLKGTSLSDKYEMSGDRLHKLADVLHGRQADLYRGMLSAWPDADDIVIDGGGGYDAHCDEDIAGAFPDFLDYMQHMDIVTYLPEDILMKVDRASMAVSLESRVPLLDHLVAEHAWSLPQSSKRRDGTAKWALREVLYRHVPKSIIDRPKMGFAAPVDHWLRGELRDWAEDLLSEKRLREEGYFKPDAIRKCWRDHLDGSRNFRFQLWAVLMFQAWRAEYARPQSAQDPLRAAG